MTDADDAVVLDVIGRANPHIPQDSVSDEVLKALKSMPDKGPLLRSLGFERINGDYRIEENEYREFTVWRKVEP